MARDAILLACAVSCCTASARAEQRFSDSDFHNAQWKFVSISNDTADSRAVLSRGADGVSRTYREVSNYVVTGAQQTRTSVVGLHVCESAVYRPQVQGGIEAVVFSTDYANHGNVYGNGERFGPALVQDGRVFLGAVGGKAQNYLRTRKNGAQPFVWQRAQPCQFNESDFVMVDTSADNLADKDSKPDFSSSGSPITFGFFTFNTNPPNLPARFSSFMTVGYDNWEIIVRSAPNNPAPARPRL